MLWPDPETSTEETEAVEWALEQAYHYALAFWLPAVTPLVIPDLDDPASEVAPDLDAFTCKDSLELWDRLVDAFVTPTKAFIWCYSYMRALWALDVDPVASLTAASGPADDEPPWPPLDPTPLPGDKGMPPKPRPKPLTPEERKAARDAQHTGYYRGLSPTGAARNGSSDFPTWLESTKELYQTIQNVPGAGDPNFGHHPPPPFETFPRTTWIRYGKPPQTPENTVTQSRTSRAWVEANWPEPTPARAGQQRLGLDLVARLVALAWDTNPSQIKTTALMVWDQASNRRRLEMFLGVYDPPVGTSIPSRVRDLIVGTTNKNSRRAIPMADFRSELHMWLRTATEVYGGHSVPSSLHPRKKPDIGMLFDQVPADRRAKWATEADARAGTVMERWYEADFEPGPPTRQAPDFYRRYRDLARESGLQAAGIINHGVLVAASTSGVEFDKVWCAHMDTRTRPTHFAADGQQVDIEAPFTVGGAHLQYPGDPSGPRSEVNNCRCRVGMNSPGAPLPREQKRNSAQKNEIIHRRRMGIIRAREDPAGIGYVPPVSVLADDVSAVIGRSNPGTAVKPKPVTGLRALNKASSISAVATAGEKMMPGVRVNFDDVDRAVLASTEPAVAASLKGAVRAARDVVDAYPELAPLLRQVVSQKSGSEYAFAQVVASDMHGTPSGLGVVLNSDWVLSPDRWKQSADADVASGFHFAGTGDPVYDCVVHEMGHVRGQYAANKLFAAGAGRHFDDIAADLIQAKADYFAHFYPDSKQELWEWEAERASGYSSENDDESIAEAFADVFINKGNAHETSKIVDYVVSVHSRGERYATPVEWPFKPFPAGTGPAPTNYVPSADEIDNW